MAEWNHPVFKTREAFEQRKQALLDIEAEQPLAWWWLSFVDDGQVLGQRFLGVAIVRARGFSTALEETFRLGVNPGGEVRGYRLDEDDLPDEGLVDRLLSKSDLLAAGMIEAD